MKSVTFHLAVLQMGTAHKEDHDIIAKCRTRIENLTRAITKERVAWDRWQHSRKDADYTAWMKTADAMHRASAIVEGLIND